MERLAGLISTNYNNKKFGKLTAHRPIASIPFGSRYRMIDFPLSNMINSGITNVGIITPHLYRSIMDHLGSGKDFGLSRKNGGLFILPGTTYGYDLGVGKFSIRDCYGNLQFFERIKADRLVLSTCSKIYNIDFREVAEYHLQKDANITLVYQTDATGDAGDIVFDFNDKGKLKGIRRLKKKEKNINLYLDGTIIEKNVMIKILDWYKDNSYIDVMDAIAENLDRFSIATYEFKGFARAISSIEDYISVSMELLDDKVMRELFTGDRLIHTKIHDAPPVKYFETAKVSNALVGTGSLIKGQIENSVIFRDVVIEEGAKIKNSVIMQRCKIGKKAVIENCICEKAVVIDEGEVHKGTEKKPAVITRD